jgi:hypothetical protein
VVAAAAQGLPCGGQPTSGVLVVCMPQRLCWLYSAVSSHSLRTVPERVSFEQSSWLVVCLSEPSLPCMCMNVNTLCQCVCQHQWRVSSTSLSLYT